MSFLRDIEKIVFGKNKEKFVFVRIGLFYESLGVEAVGLSERLGLKPGKMGYVEKVGFPESAFFKYTRMLENLSYSFKIYDIAKVGECIFEKVGDKKYTLAYEYFGISIPVSKRSLVELNILNESKHELEELYLKVAVLSNSIKEKTSKLYGNDYEE